MTKKRARKLRRQGLIALVVVVAFLISSIFFVNWYKENTLKKQSELVDFEYPYEENQYDWSKIERDGPYMSYEDDIYTSLQGIDVSSHQEEIDWKQVADDGVDFAFIRAAYRGYVSGDFWPDEQFDRNMSEANKYGIDAGIYVFSQAITIEEAAEEADYAIQVAKKYHIDLPIVYDMEESIDEDLGRVSVLDVKEKTQIAVTFMNRIRAAGYESMYYGSTSLLEQYFEIGYLQKYPLWVAEYESSYPNYPYTFEYWQYTSTATIPGIDGVVDMNIRFVKK